MTEERKILLLIEDNPLLTDLYKAAFEQSGYTVLTAHDGNEGLRLARETHPDGIILDLLMPGGIDGFSVLESLKKEEETKSSKVIVFSSITDDAIAERVKNLGAVDCLLKSEFSVAELIARVVSYLPQ